MEVEEVVKKKGGFKGKRKRSKFTRNARTGAEQKIKLRPTRNDAGADDEPSGPPAHDTPNPPVPARTSRAASRKTTNSELRHKLGIITRKNKRLSRDKEEGMKKSKKLQDKLDKSEGIRSELCDTVRHAHIDKREARKNEAAVEQKLADANKMYNKEHEELVHKLEVDVKKAAEDATAIQDRKYKKELRGKDKEHQSSMKAIIKLHRKEKDELLDEVDAIKEVSEHKAREAERAMAESREVSEHNAREAEHAMAECRRIRREKDEEIDKWKVKHRDSMQRLKKTHASQITAKNTKLENMRKELEHARENVSLILDEHNAEKKSNRQAQKKALDAELRALNATREYKSLLDKYRELKDDFCDMKNKVEELEEKVAEYDMIIELMQNDYEDKSNEYKNIIDYMDHYYEETRPRKIGKRWVRNEKSGAHAEWLPHVDKLIIEMLSNRTPPTCIQANIYAMACSISPNEDLVTELPSLKHIKNLRTVLSLMTKSLAAYSFGHAKEIKQMHNDETSRRHVPLINTVVTILGQNDKLKTLCLSGSIIADDKSSEAQTGAIMSYFEEAGRLLKAWRERTAQMYTAPADSSLKDMIPEEKMMDPVRLNKGMISHDNAPGANSTGKMIEDQIRKLCKDKELNDDDVHIYQGHCWNHLRNTWFEAVENYLAKKLEAHLKHDLDLIPFHLRVSCKLCDLLYQCDKEYSEMCNYEKGSGSGFHHFRKEKFPGKRYLPMVRVLGGSRQDSSFEGAFPVYDGREDMLAFTSECLLSSENLLQRCLLITLSSTEVVAQLRVASILFLSVIMPMRWLAGNTHKLAHRNWGERSMGMAADLLHKAFVKIQADGKLLLDHDFMMNIFSDLKIPELDAYLKYEFEEKMGNGTGSNKCSDRVLAVGEAMTELFWPTKQTNRDTTQFIIDELAVGVATTLLVELVDPKKSTFRYLSAADGKYSMKNISEEDVNATIGMRANNDPSEGNFATFTDILVNCGRISLQSAAGIGQMRYNKDMFRKLDDKVTGRKSKKDTSDTDIDEVTMGTYHLLPEKLQDSLLATCKSLAAKSRSNFNNQLHRQRVKKAEKIKIENEKLLKTAEEKCRLASTLHQQWTSPRCVHTPEDAMDVFEKLIFKTKKLVWVKDQIHIRYIGLGWEEAYHPWSRKGHGVYTPVELLKHLIEVVLPLRYTNKVPDKPPVELPTRPDTYKLGTVTADLTALDNKQEAKEYLVRLEAMIERERLEDKGIGDQMASLQQTHPPWKRIKDGTLKRIEMCFSMNDGTLIWSQGSIKVVKDMSEKRNYIEVDVTWDESCLAKGEAPTSKEKIEKKNWNTDKHHNGTWREDLSELIITSDDIE